MASHTYPAKPKTGDLVAILSPSAGLPGEFPQPYELGLRRLREDFGVVPVEYATTRRMGSSPADRAADIHDAFSDKSVRAVFASIGGDDQITVIPHLDPDILRANPKPFFGYSDNTNLLSHLWNLGIVAYHGGAVMVQFGRPGAMHPVTAHSLRAAMFTSGEYELLQVDSYGDVERPWNNPETFTREPEMSPGEGWIWHNPDRVVEGASWGGNIEVLSWMLMADRVQPPEEYDGCVLFLETSEELPSAEMVYRILRGMAERGLLSRFPAAVIGRAKTWSLEHPTSAEERERYRQEQRAAFLQAFAEYAPDAMLVFDVDFGHTDPQVVIPYGGTVRVDGPARRIVVTY